MKMTSESYSAAATSKGKASVLARLKSETQVEHDAIEEVLDLMSDSLTPDAYRRIVERFYGYYRPMEQAIFSLREGEVEWGILEGRRKTSLLEQDLQSLGIASPNSLPLCGQTPRISSAESVYGSLYVMEGATLGGQHISRHIHRVLNVSNDSGGRFFHSYGQRTGEMWQTFRASLDSFATTPETQDQVIKAALETFSTLRNWFIQGNSV
jgi:heme oxygenase (biliverdin-IX-beta and delta-forming)